MLILALETATRAGSLAIVGPGRRHAVSGDGTRTHGARLPRELFDFASANGVGLADIGRLVVVSGPGSFTGLRIGLATIQGIAVTTGLLIVPVPTLDALAASWQDANRDRPARLVTVLDGARGDVFFSVFDCDGVARPRAVMEAAVGSPGEAGERAAMLAGGRPAVVIGDGAVRYRAALAPVLGAATFDEVLPNLALGAALLGSERVDASVGPHALRPLYVRRPDAVLARERAQARRALSAVTVARATSSEDVMAIAALQRRSFVNAWGEEAIRWEIDHSPVARLYAARIEDGTIVGYCACWMVYDELHVNSIAVDGAWQRRGVARRMLQHVFTEAIDEGARSATLEVRHSNDAGRRLYEQLGFQVEAVRRDYYQDPREDALILWHRDLRGRFGPPHR